MSERKIQYRVINGKRCQRYVGDDGWVICEVQK